MTTELEPITPSETKEMYLEARKNELSKTTLDGYHYRLKHFIRWCEDVEQIANMNDLSGRDIQKFKTWRRNEGDLKPVTMESNLDTLRLFLRWCTSIDAVESGLHKKVEALMPSLDRQDEQAESILSADEAKALMEYQRKFDYASKRHIIIELLWYTGIRLGSLRSLDVDDYDGDTERLELRHRPDTGTPLKNDRRGERMVALTPDLCRIIEDWIEQHRCDVTDEYGREPLLTSRQGRMNQSSIRDIVYRVTQPCHYAQCPKGRDPEDCQATNYGHHSKCPVNVSPHDIRRGSITHFLTEDVPKKVVSDRMDVGEDVLDKHYDKRDEKVKVEQRRDYVENI